MKHYLIIKCLKEVIVELFYSHVVKPFEITLNELVINQDAKLF
jgi:hypothetical protein